ncbi:DUF255 domain-containing protein [Pelosinus sp. IPA-1]|uniref:DUF255 domain-containing protein n=1 Tax=Pelosinus sp. IPA-1 TaxID=3029569 RepID=UPI0024361E40|nr:DUF255 domain-containing protein [Pelosinus sp. IPA-1]GMA99525.1 hypothetical protein PIPA1_23250 [Pelosinus sp. IPA-1]
MATAATSSSLRFDHEHLSSSHAHNPVDWYPWEDEAFEKAKQESKPVFLSVGYSTCHWSDVTTGEVREAIKRGEQAIAEESRANGMAHQNAE